MILAQGVWLGMTLCAVGCMGYDLKHREGFPWWVYLLMIGVFLADYKVIGGM